MNHIDNPEINDNRKYTYSEKNDTHRIEYDIIEKWIPQNAKIIDLGCGDGNLMSFIQKQKNTICKGIEISESGVEIAQNRGLDVVQGRIDVKLPFENQAFDYSICNVTMQMVEYPEVLFTEMLRISKVQIISFPNFAYFSNRFQLFFGGRMPKKMLFGYNWYNTGHIHQFSIQDFYDLLNQYNLKVINKDFLPYNQGVMKMIANINPNFFQRIAIFQITNK